MAFLSILILYITTFLAALPMANLAYVVGMLRALQKLVTAFHDFSLLHPLSRFPGPKILPATISNEALFELLKAGRLTWEIREIHKEIQ